VFISCIRGAITVNSNTKEEILNATKELLNNIIEANKLSSDEIVSILFTCTRDLDEAYPAVAARDIGITKAALMCVQEMYVKGSLTMCIRVMLQIQSDRTQTACKHIYLKNAAALRPDLEQK
jgi:chorismate mutase